LSSGEQVFIHLQARLRMDVGGQPAKWLSEFYAAIFAQTLQASQSASKAKFEHAIDCVRNVRDAWRQVAKDSDANPASPRGDRNACAPNRRNRRFRRQCGYGIKLDSVSSSMERLCC
jgi:hypothetical protein